QMRHVLFIWGHLPLSAFVKLITISAMDTIRILLADDHANVRTQIHARLARESGFTIVGEAAHSSEAIDMALKTQPDVVLMDPIMRDGRGLVAVNHIGKSMPHTALVILTAYADTALQVELRRLGARLILDKGIESAKLIELIRGLFHGCQLTNN